MQNMAKTGGKSITLKLIATVRVDVYNARENTWHRGPDLPERFAGGPAVVYGSRLHLIGGAQVKDAEAGHHFVIDLAAERPFWTRLAALPKSRIHPAGEPKPKPALRMHLITNR